jgi:hypothetical protein
VAPCVSTPSNMACATPYWEVASTAIRSDGGGGEVAARVLGNAMFELGGGCGGGEGP